MGQERFDTDEVRAFLAQRHGVDVDGIASVEPLAGGAWSRAWGYRVGEEELVLRFGAERSWFEADRRAMAFDGPDLPVPEVREVGDRAGGAYAISVRHHGGFLEDVPIEHAGTLAPTLTRLLVALHDVPRRKDLPVVWHQEPPDPRLGWRDWLLASLVDAPDRHVHGWRKSLAADPNLERLFTAAEARVRELSPSCPERRDLVHGDLLHGNVLVSDDASRIEAVLSWKCSLRGDFLFDAAWCSFWGGFHPAIAAAEPLAGVLAAPSVLADPGALEDAGSRHHCYETHIGATHLGWYVWIGDRVGLEAVARRLSEVLERGPVTTARDGRQR